MFRIRSVAVLALATLSGPWALSVAQDAPQPFTRTERRTDSALVEQALQGDRADFGGWTTEVAGAKASDRLHRIEDWLAGREARLPRDLAEATGTFALLPTTGLKETLDDGVLRVRRAAGPIRPGPPTDRRFADVLSSLRGATGLDGPPQVHFKVFQVEEAEGGFTTTVLVDAVVQAASAAVQLNGTWTIDWAWKGPSGAEPVPSRLTIERHEVVELRRGEPLFQDVTASAMRAVDAYETQFLPDVVHWGSRVSTFDYNSILGHSGMAIGDANDDGLDDVYVCETGGLPNRLLLQQPDGTLRDVSASAGVDWLEHSFSALFLDLDGDGDQDLVVGSFPMLLIHENVGESRFEVRQAVMAVDQAYALSSADFDGDGDLDLYLATYGAAGPGSSGTGAEGERKKRRARPTPYYDANNGGRNALMRNDGAFQFSDVTEAVGLDVNNRRYSFASAWEDFDLDGDVDLYVANDFGRNNLYLNEDGKFRDIAARAGVEDVGSGMSVAWGDPDRDGRADLYVGNMFSAAGNRIAYQRQFAPGQDDETVSLLRRTARGNSLFSNSGDGTFHDISVEAGVTMGRWAWSSVFADLNNDGWEDLVVANGFISGDDTGDL